MASSNRHWPSMFKSKPCNSHHPWQHDINQSSLLSTGCHRSPYSSGSGCEERTPEPKPRWNPKPEQIRILEAIFNSGMVNPPRDEIRKIRAQLQEYGQVGDANVFYWFQNRKSRSKHKLRHLQNSSKHQQNTASQVAVAKTLSTLAPSSSSSSSEKTSPPLGSKRGSSVLSMGTSSHALDVSSSPTCSVNQNMFQNPHDDFLSEHFLFPPIHPTVCSNGTGGLNTTQGFFFSDTSNFAQIQDCTVGPSTSLLLSEFFMNSGVSKSDINESQLEERTMMGKMIQQQMDYSLTSPITYSIGRISPLFSSSEANSGAPVTSTIGTVLPDDSQAGPEQGSSANTTCRSTIFINDVQFEVAAGPFNVRDAFGDDVLLVHSSGQPVLTDDWGVTLQSLQHGGLYYLVPLTLTDHI